MNITVTLDDLETVRDHGTMIEITGTSQDGTERVTFAGDHRPMNGMLAAVTDAGHLVASVEPWSVLRRVPA